jgi:hypothetical protein
MAAGKYNIVIEQGADFSLTFTIKDDGVARDLTGWSARGQIRLRASSASTLAVFDCSIPSPTSGTVEVKLSNTITSALQPTVARYDVEIFTAGDAQVERILQGTATIDPEITK